MDSYHQKIRIELEFWKREMMQAPSFLNKTTYSVQKKINSYIPDKAHQVITNVMKGIIQTVLYGSTYTTSSTAPEEMSLMHREALILQKIDAYSKTGAAEGGITGAGGFLMSMADFPILIGIKMKMLFEIAALYGYEVKDYRERLYILYIFQLAFSSKQGTKKIFMHIHDWEKQLSNLPENPDDFDWLTFQQEYRDYIDLAKLAQLLPVVGAAVGAIANYQLIKKLGKTAMQAYRLRMMDDRTKLI